MTESSAVAQFPEALDESLAHQTLQGLSALIAAIFEDRHLLAAKRAKDAHGDALLRQAGEDVAALASAMQIIRRRLPL